MNYYIRFTLLYFTLKHGWHDGEFVVFCPYSSVRLLHAVHEVCMESSATKSTPVCVSL